MFGGGRGEVGRGEAGGRSAQMQVWKKMCAYKLIWTVDKNMCMWIFFTFLFNVNVSFLGKEAI